MDLKALDAAPAPATTTGMTTFDGILFDKDGTLFDFEATWSGWAYDMLGVLAQGDPDLAGVLGQAVGYDYSARRFRPGSVIIAGTPVEIAAAFAAHLPARTASDILRQLDDSASLAHQQPTVPLAPLLDGLRGQGLALGIATNDSEVPTRAHLQGAGILEQFEFIAGSDSGYGGKPAPGQLLAFASQLALDPARCVMVGDSAHDLSAGRAAGMACVAVLTGPSRADDLAPLADVVLPDIGHLPDWLDGVSRV